MIIKAVSVNKEYKRRNLKEKILKNISLNIDEGEFVSIIGPSGSGKSTLLYILSGLEPPTSGDINIFNTNLNTLTDKEKCKLRNEKFGFVFQMFNLVEELNVEENVFLPIAIGDRSLNVNKNRISEVIDMVGLSNRKNYYPKELSGGQQQRVSIARALITNPKIIFADEPIGSLDSTNGKQVMEIFRNINKTYGTTIVQVTHSMESTKYGDRVIGILDGMINEDSKM